MGENIAILTNGDGVKGRTVIKRLLEDERFTDKYSIRVIVDGGGKTTRSLERWNVTWEPTSDPNNPRHALIRLFGDSGIDYLVSCGYSYKISNSTIEMANKDAINCHSSYLPDYKGVSIQRPQWAHAEKVGGATIHRLTQEIDNGDIITQSRFKIEFWDTPLDIIQKYSDITTPLLREALLLLEEGYEGESQPNGGRYYSEVPWSTTFKHGAVNHLLRAIGVPWRWTIPSHRHPDRS